jgi:hypothetical protein
MEAVLLKECLLADLIRLGDRGEDRRPIREIAKSHALNLPLLHD